MQPGAAGGVEDRFGAGVDGVVEQRGFAVVAGGGPGVAAQGVGVQDEGVGDLQLPQPFGAADQDAGPGEVGAEDRVEGGGAVPGGLG
ncbi:hypothetical protein RKD26_000306 [Streptomyces calvus]